MGKAIFFDLDGTLTDSGEGIINCTIMTLERYGLPVPAREDLRFVVGPPLKDSFFKLGVPADKLDEAVAIYRSRYIPIGKFENTPYPGVEEMLKKLKADGHKLYVATSKPEVTSIEILDHFGLSSYFEIISGALTDGTRHSKSQVIAHLLSQIVCDEAPTMVGDTAFDVLGAAEHGIATIGVDWGYGETTDMVKAGAKAIAYTMDELYDLLT